MYISRGLRTVRPQTRLQRVIAALVGVWLVVGGILGARHEAQVAHVLDSHTGEIRHADVVADSNRDSTQPAYHRVASQSDADVCGIATALHQAARPASAAPPSTTPELQVAQTAAIHHDDTAAVAAVYRFAPKTSPPTLG